MTPRSDRPAAGGGTPAGPRWLAGVLVGAAYAALFGPALLGMAADWWASDDYRYGFLLLPVALYLAWRRRDADGPESPDGTDRLIGSVVLGGAVLLLVAGYVAAEFFTQRFSALVALAGLTIFYLGRRQLRAWWLPFALLLFTIPLPAVALNALTLPLQLLASRAAAAWLRFRHVPALVQGNIIHLPGQSLFVAEACSGLRSLSALFGFTLLIGGTRLSRPWSRAGLLALALPAALAANAFRVFVTGYLSFYFGPGMAEGAAHEAVGVVVFVAALGLVGVAALLLRRWEKRRRGDRRPSGSAASATPSSSPPSRAALPAGGSVLLTVLPVVLLGLGLLGTWRARPAERLPLREPLATLPDTLAGFSLSDTSSLDRASLSVLRPDSYLLRHYDPGDPSADGGTVGSAGGFDLFVAYYGRQVAGSTIHSPRNCLPGNGWEPTEHGTATIRTDRGPAEVNRYVIQGPGGRRAVVYYWYQGRGRIAANEYRVKWDLLRDGVVRRRTDEALVRLVFMKPSGERTGSNASSADAGPPADPPARLAAAAAVADAMWRRLPPG